MCWWCCVYASSPYFVGISLFLSKTPYLEFHNFYLKFLISLYEIENFFLCLIIPILKSKSQMYHMYGVVFFIVIIIFVVQFLFSSFLFFLFFFPCCFLFYDFMIVKKLSSSFFGQSKYMYIYFYYIFSSIICFCSFISRIEMVIR